MPSSKQLMGGSFILVLLIIAIFVTAQLPIAKKEVHDLPILLVNEDKGPIGAQLTTTLTTTVEASEERPVALRVVETTKEMERAFKRSEAYGALVIPSSYSEQMEQSVKTGAARPTFTAWVNEGANAQAAMIVRQFLQTIESQFAEQQKQSALAQLETTDRPILPKMVERATTPTPFEWKVAHPTNGLESAPLSIFQPLWIASLLGAVLLFIAGKQTNLSTRRINFQFRSIQLLVAVALGTVIGFGTTYATKWMLGFDYLSTGSLALFLSIASVSFILLILTTISWIGIGGIIVFVLLLFFGLPILQLPPEMLPPFYVDWVLPWLPMRFLLEGVSEILFFGSTWQTDATPTLLLLLFGAAFLLVLRGFFPQSTQSS